MTQAHKIRRAFCLFTGTVVLSLAFVVSASGAVASEQQQGALTLRAVQAGELNGRNLSHSQYEQVGEFLMSQALGSTSAHERMNSLMAQMMGSTASDQMHAYLGQRYLGRSAGIPRAYMPMYGLIGMMTGYRSSSIAGRVSGYLGEASNGMAGSTTGSGMMGSRAQSNSGMGWPMGAVVAICVLAVLLLAGVITAAMSTRHRGGGDPHGQAA